VPYADDLVSFEVEGPARLLAVGNGDPEDHSSYQSEERRAFHGLVLGIIQSTDATGSVRVTARADGLETAALEIKTIPGVTLPRLP